MTKSNAHWLRELSESPTIDALAARLASQRHVIAQGSWGSSTYLLAGMLAVKTAKPVLLVVAHLDDADDALEDLALFDAAQHPLHAQRFSALEVLPGESTVNLELLAERLAVVQTLADQTRPPQSEIRNQQLEILIAPIQALMQTVPKPEALRHYSITLRRGQTLPPGELLDWLDRAGYTRTDAIEQPGDFATRGGIIDIYAPAPGNGQVASGGGGGGGGAPIRLDYFGDEIDAINLVDTDTMGSGLKLESFQLIGASLERLQRDDDEHTTSLMALLPQDTIVMMHEPLELAEQARGYFERLTDSRGIISPPAVMRALMQKAFVEVHQYGAAAQAQASFPLPVSTLMSFDHDAANAVRELAELSGEARVIVQCQQPAERQRLLELIQEHAPQANDRIEIDIGYLHRGFVWHPSPPGRGWADEVGPGEGTPNENPGPTAQRNADSSDVPSPQPIPRAPKGRGSWTLHLIPHHELFHRYQTRRRIRRVGAGAGAAAGAGTRAADAFLDLSPGDYVVHVDHGVAKFVALRTMRRTSGTEDYLTLEFAKRAILHVPATQIELVQKYIGGFHGRPPLSLLGGKRWSKQKQQVAEAVKDLAAELLRIQAARASLPGVRYPADTAWQKEFEAEFPYEETDDQLAALAEIKKDMADEQPMDRLICGDVGFGKTELAIRAAFKAVEFGKQVAVLVPTTVLAEQHERTFRERMADYPFRIESISRFKTGKEQSKLIKELAQGKIDVIIGTHRVLSQDVKFADLGLVVIDEEQRFGVEHKQRLLQFRLTADVLTLSATPIPRTLHMSMLGLRDISSLSTPPMDRRAIVTEVMGYDKHRVKTALLRELNRDGQIFFVHNRVHDIHSIADDVRKLVPEARIVVGHGQMPAGELEDVMLTFMRRDADILVCTTIIESGIDIPTANTIFIDDADFFGLADLHQLRGRVGRYKHRAYCYLLLPDDRPITDKAARRLKAIEQYAMLGAGFKIAMRDLEIRGAGNLLGAEQSGHIAAVGYQMYCQLLEQEARKLRRERTIEPVKTHMELPISGRLLPSYIPTDKHRMEAYRRLTRAASVEELEAVIKDITDAYGDAPPQVQTLFDLCELRVAVSNLEVESLKLDGQDLIFRTRTPRLVFEALEGAAGRLSLIDDNTVYYRPPANYIEQPTTLLAVLRKLLGKGQTVSA